VEELVEGRGVDGNGLLRGAVLYEVPEVPVDVTGGDLAELVAPSGDEDRVLEVVEDPRVAAEGLVGVDKRGPAVGFPVAALRLAYALFQVFQGLRGGVADAAIDAEPRHVGR